MKKITKSAIIKELRGLWNTTKVIEGINVARVCWKSEEWMIIENEDTFEDCAKDQFVPILSYYYQQELVNRLYKSINQIK